MTRGKLAAVLLLTVTLLWLGAPAHAAEVTPKEGVRELDRSRALVTRSLVLFERGATEEAYEAARNAYLDHFEYVEIPLRVRDEALTLELEEDFATLRNQIEAGFSLEEVEATAGELRRGLDRVERRLSEPGLAAPILAFASAFVILFREGIEAVLVIAAILGYLEASRNNQYRGAILRGVGAAGIATVVTFIAASVLLNIAPVQRELLEAGTAIAAVVVLFYVSFWLVTRLEHRRWMEFVKAKVWTATTTGSALALAAVGFTAVYREGFETVLFYQALLSFAEGLTTWVALGTASGALALGVVAYLVFKAGRRLPVKAFLTTAVLLVMALSVAFVGNAVRALQQAALLPVHFLGDVPRLPIFLAELTGWHPTRETILAQAALTVVYVAGALWTFVVLPRRERRFAAAAQEPVAPARTEEEQHSAVGGS
ncbi:MAG: FTR1 family protein [Actinomycetota bacterium]